MNNFSRQFIGYNPQEFYFKVILELSHLKNEAHLVKFSSFFYFNLIGFIVTMIVIDRSS